MGVDGVLRKWVWLLPWAALGGCATPAPPPPALPPMPVQGIQVEGVEGVDADALLADAVAPLLGQPYEPALAGAIAERITSVLAWREWRDISVVPDPAPGADGVLRVAVQAQPPDAPEGAPSEWFDIPMPRPPEDVVPAPTEPGGARLETALDASFQGWLASPARALISAEDRRIYVKRDGEVISYPVAVGTRRTPTPAGEYWVEAITHKPTWYPTARIRREHAAKGKPLPRFVPPGRGNPLGQYFVRLQNSIGIHGTNQPRSIGRAASQGCVRMHDRDVSELVRLLKAGDRIQVVPGRAPPVTATAAPTQGSALRATLQQ